MRKISGENCGKYSMYRVKLLPGKNSVLSCVSGAASEHENVHLHIVWSCAGIYGIHKCVGARDDEKSHTIVATCAITHWTG